MAAQFFTPHSTQRMSQRNVTAADLDFVCRYGREYHAAGATFFFLGERDIPAAFRHSAEGLIGVTVVFIGERLATVYRNREAVRRIKRKPRHFLSTSKEARS